MSTIATDSPAPGAAARSEDRRFGLALRFGVAALVLCAAVAAACIVMVPAGEAMVITRFGNPIRVITQPGLAWKWPAPIESTIPVDLRLRTTSTGLQDVGTSDGLRVLVQAYVAWQVPGNAQRVRQFLRSVRNQPDDAARQLRSYVNAALHIISSNFAMTELVNMDAQKVRLDDFEDQVRKQIAPRMLQVYGIDIRQVGVERMTLPDETLAATVQRMKAERETVAAQRTAEGLKEAAAIRADADKDARELVAKAREQAADTEADAQQAAARIYGDAYKADPALYSTLRSLDTINQVVGRNTRVVLRTDAAPFRVLVDGPEGLNLPGPATAKAPKTGTKAWRETGGKGEAAPEQAAAGNETSQEATRAAAALERQLSKIAADSAADPSKADKPAEPRASSGVPSGPAAAPERAGQ
jgi:membrane protease subunit HflC